MNDGLPTIKFDDRGRKFTCYFFPVEATPPDRAGKLVPFFRIWKNVWKNNIIPSWGNFTFEDFIGWHTYMRVMDVGGTIDDYKTNLIVGESFAQCFGRTTLYEVIKSGAVPKKKESIVNYKKYLSYMFDQHYCISEGTATDNNGHIRKFKWLDLPLSDDGKNVTHLITAINYQK